MPISKSTQASGVRGRPHAITSMLSLVRCREQGAGRHARRDGMDERGDPDHSTRRRADGPHLRGRDRPCWLPGPCPGVRRRGCLGAPGSPGRVRAGAAAVRQRLRPERSPAASAAGPPRSIWKGYSACPHCAPSARASCSQDCWPRRPDQQVNSAKKLEPARSPRRAFSLWRPAMFRSGSGQAASRETSRFGVTPMACAHVSLRPVLRQ